MESGYKSVVQNGSIRIPDELKDFFIEDTMVICKGTEKSLFVYQKEAWKAFEENLVCKVKNPAMKATVSFFLKGAVELHWNKEQMEVPDWLMNFAEIEDGDEVEILLECGENGKLRIQKRSRHK